MEANNLKEKRDAINLKVKELKALRDQAKIERQERRAHILKVKEKMKTLWRKKPSRNLSDIEREIESLDWKIQTTPLSVKEEKTQINQVRILESQRLIHKQIQELKDALIKLQTEEKALEARAKLSHEKLAELAKQSQSFHEKMMETLNKAQILKAEADVAHQKYLEINQNAYATHQRCMELLQQIKSLKQEIQQKEKEQQTKRQEQLREEAAKKALEKLKRGERLTWEEFKILAEQGII